MDKIRDLKIEPCHYHQQGIHKIWMSGDC